MILTIGHSRHPLKTLLYMLDRHGIQAVVDVRRKPYSRRHPQYDREGLAAALSQAGIDYFHQEALGGLREPRPDSPHVGLPAPIRGFADHMETPAFHTALGGLIQRSRAQRVAILCAEASPGDCHRSLISDALVTRGEEVEHILDADRREAHHLTSAAQVVHGALLYLGWQARLDLESR